MKTKADVEHALDSLAQNMGAAYRRLAGHADGRDIAQLREQLRQHGSEVRRLRIELGDQPDESLLAEVRDLAGKASRTIDKANNVYIFEDEVEPPAVSTEPKKKEAKPAPPASFKSADKPAEKVKADESEPSNAALLKAIESLQGSTLNPEHREVIESFSPEQLRTALQAGLIYHGYFLSEEDVESEPEQVPDENAENASNFQKVFFKWLEDRRMPRRYQPVHA